MSHDNDEVGYKRPPKKSQFKKGQSGCPDGGHERRREKREAKIRKEKDQAADLASAIIRRFAGMKEVRIDGKPVALSTLELSLIQLEEDVIRKRDPSARKLWFDIMQKNGWLKPPKSSGKGGGVLVVYAPYSEEKWDKATEGQLLSVNPLEGIPGAERLRVDKKRRGESAD